LLRYKTVVGRFARNRNSPCETLRDLGIEKLENPLIRLDYRPSLGNAKSRLSLRHQLPADQRGIVRNNSGSRSSWSPPSRRGDATPMAIVNMTILAQITPR